MLSVCIIGIILIRNYTSYYYNEYNISIQFRIMVILSTSSLFLLLLLLLLFFFSSLYFSVLDFLSFEFLLFFPLVLRHSLSLSHTRTPCLRDQNYTIQLENISRKVWLVQLSRLKNIRPDTSIPTDYVDIGDEIILVQYATTVATTMSF